jgi:hypothetical protein
LLELKSRIIDNSENSGIFDSAKYTLDIEQAYRSALTDQNSRTRHLADSRR